MDQGKQRVEDNIPKNEEDLDEEVIQCRAYATGVACDMDKDESDAVDDDEFLLSDSIECVIFF